MLPASAKVRKEKGKSLRLSRKNRDILMRKRKEISYLFLGEPIATSVLADLVTLLVPARGTVSAVVFPLASRTFSATLSLLLRWLLVGVCVLAPGEQANISNLQGEHQHCHHDHQHHDHQPVEE